MHIAVCDDDIEELDHVGALLKQYRDLNKAALTFTCFHDCISLLDTLSEQTFDLLLLDVMMPGMTGLSAAKEIRTMDKIVKIIFLTSSPEFAVESYRVNATDYFLKPITAEALFPILDNLFLCTPEPILKIKTEGGLLTLPFSQIVYLDVMNRRVCFHLSDGTAREVFGYLSDYEKALLSVTNFVKSHRSCLVNLDHVREVSTTGIITDIGMTVPVSKGCYAQVKLSYAKYLFTEVEDDI